MCVPEVQDLHHAVILAVHGAQIGVLPQHGGFGLPALIADGRGAQADPFSPGHAGNFDLRIGRELLKHLLSVAGDEEKKKINDMLRRISDYKLKLRTRIGDL